MEVFKGFLSGAVDTGSKKYLKKKKRNKKRDKTETKFLMFFVVNGYSIKVLKKSATNIQITLLV